MKLNTRCIRCGSTNNLNTTLNVVVDGNKYDVVLCDDHEDTSPKQVKDLVKNKIDTFNQIMQQMQEFGVTVSDTSSGIAIASKRAIDLPDEEGVSIAQPVVQKPQTEQSVPPKQESAHKPNVRVSKTPPKKIKSIAGTARDGAGGVQVEGHQTIDVDVVAQVALQDAKSKGMISENAQLPVRTDAEYQEAIGPSGQPMKIPKKIKYSDGETKIAIINTGGDQTIQQRFRSLAKCKDPYAFREGYDVKSCNACDGTGFSKIKTDSTCPKCGGVGFLNKGW